MTMGGGNYLLPSGIVLSIENRDRIQLLDTDRLAKSYLIGRYSVGNLNWPAYLFESEALFEPDWTHAVFLKTARRPVGMVAKNVSVISQEQTVRLESFTVIGNLLEGGPLFSEFWANMEAPALVFDAKRVSEYFSKMDENYGDH